MNGTASAASLTRGISASPKLTSARFHHKLRRFISGREINAGSVFQFDSNLILIELLLVIAT